MECDAIQDTFSFLSPMFQSITDEMMNKFTDAKVESLGPQHFYPNERKFLDVFAKVTFSKSQVPHSHNWLTKFFQKPITLRMPIITFILPRPNSVIILI